MTMRECAEAEEPATQSAGGACNCIEEANNICLVAATRLGASANNERMGGNREAATIRDAQSSLAAQLAASVRRIECTPRSATGAWTPVTTPPPKAGHYLALRKGDQYTELGSNYFDGKDWRFSDGSNCSDYPVEWWMPLPSAPADRNTTHG